MYECFYIVINYSVHECFQETVNCQENEQSYETLKLIDRLILLK